MEITLNTEQLLAVTNENESNSDFNIVPAGFEIFGLRFRLPCSRDLAAISGEQDINAATAKLLERCCLDRPKKMDEGFSSIVTEVEAVMEKLDPAAELNLSLSCENCGHSGLANLNIGALLWDEIDVRARALLSEVHSLARAYGWTEPEILALSPQRRAAYLDRVNV